MRNDENPTTVSSWRVGLRTAEMKSQPVATDHVSGKTASHRGHTHDDLSQQAPVHVAEQYRKLKTWLLKLTKNDFRNLIMITSAVSGEGKSVTAANLAITMAEELNQTVLLVDADLRRPSLQDYLKIGESIGITDCLADGADAGKAIIKTAIPKLSFLGAGRKVKNPAELLSSSRMRELLGELKQRYHDRYVIIDTPPVLPFAETQVLGQLVDGVLFVVREGMTTLVGVSDALESLHGAELLGIVYNDASVGSLMDRYGYSGYGYDRYQRHGEGRQ